MLSVEENEEDSKDSLENRMQLRAELESSGLLRIFLLFKEWGCKDDVLEAIETYEDERSADNELAENNYKFLNETLRDPSEVLSELMDLLKKLPEPERSQNLVLRSLSSVFAMVKMLHNAKDDNDSNAEYSVLSLKILERLTGTLSGNATAWVARHPGVESRTRKAKMQTLASEIIYGIEFVSGVPLHLGTGRSITTQSDSNSAQELANIKYMYNETLLTNDELQKENDLLREKLASSGIKANEEAINSAAVQKELKQLQETITLLTEENKQLKEELTPAIKQEKEETVMSSQPPPPPTALEPLPPLNIPKPVSALLPLTWTKVPPASVYNSVWKSIVEKAYVDEKQSEKILDSEELTRIPDIFKKEIAEPTSPRIPNAGKRRIAITLIDMKRATNLEILLASLRVSHGKLKDALLTVDDNVLNSERLAILAQVIPTDEEIEIVVNYSGDKSELGNVEKFINAMSFFPRFGKRITSLVYRNKFQEELEDMLTDLSAIEKAATAVQNSQRFLYALEVILVVGNFLNEGSFRGKAYGFVLAGLAELERTKANNKSDYTERAPTLLHYVARRIDETEPDFIDLKDELAPVEVVSQVDVNSLFLTIKSLGNGLDAIKEELEFLRQQQPLEGDMFIDIMGAFVASSEVRVAKVMAQATDIQNLVKKVIKSFGEDDRVTIPDDFFRTIWDFQKSLQRAHSENMATEDLWRRRGKDLTLLTRRTLPSAMLLALQAKKNRLKAVDGALPFAQRLTVRRPMLKSKGLDGLGVSAPSGDGLMTRRMTRRVGTIRTASTRVASLRPSITTEATVQEERDESAKGATSPGAMPVELQQLLAEAAEWEAKNEGVDEGEVGETSVSITLN
ncbi:hypothetical protein HDU96_003003 [Phlyctochytrium bullatum]|nr:hypothetical protein HDU96_003003 [Phlyctochytrium bullatum]